MRLSRTRAEAILRPGAGTSDPHQYVDYLENQADADNKAKQCGVYVDIGDDGAPLVPHEIDRPGLAAEIWGAAGTVKSMLADRLIVGDRDPGLDYIEGLIAPILERDSSG